MLCQSQPELLESLRSDCERRLEAADCARVTASLAKSAVHTPQLVQALRDHVDQPSESTALSGFKTAAFQEGCAELTFERTVLLQGAAVFIPRIAAASMPDSVVSLLCDDIRFVMESSVSAFRWHELPRAGFSEMARKLLLRRYSGGQFDWEVTSLPIASLARCRGLALPRAAAFALLRMRGGGPVFFSHLNRRRRSKALDEREALKSYYRMTEAMALQPSIIGFAACSWFRSPDTHRVSPRLAWLSKVFLENGGFVAAAGSAQPDCGVLFRSATRRRLYEEGSFAPTNGLVLWPRRAMLAWARRHPDLAD